MKETPLYMVFVLYLIISSNFLAQLFPCRLQYALNNNMMLKHVAGYMTLLFFVVLASGDEYSASWALLYALMIYTLFWVSTRMSFEYLLVFLLLNATLYIMHLYEKETNKGETSNLHIAKMVVQATMFVVLVLGVLFYWAEKKIEYKKKFSWKTFVIGKPICKNKSPPRMSFKKMFEYYKK